MASIILDTMDRLKEMSTRYPEGVLVSYSGGKDSLVVLDMCVRNFSKVVCFFMYFVPGLRIEEEMLDKARKRYGVEILQYPNWSSIAALRAAVYCNENKHLPNDYGLNDVYTLARADTGLRLIAMGIKKSDNEFRRKNKNLFLRADTFSPLEHWNKLEVLAYLSHHKIPLSDITDPKKQTGGIDLSAPSLCRLHDTHPDDFEKLLEWYPYASAVVARRDFFGVKK